MKPLSNRLAITLGTLLALGLAGSAGQALAASPPMADGPMMAMMTQGWHRPDGRHGPGMMRHAGMFGHGRPARLFAAMRDLRALQHLYLVTGRRGDAEAMYRQVLAETSNPVLRNFAFGHLARLQAMPVNPDAAIATLRQALQENLKAIPAPAAAPRS